MGCSTAKVEDDKLNTSNDNHKKTNEKKEIKDLKEKKDNNKNEESKKLEIKGNIITMTIKLSKGKLAKTDD